MSPASQRTRAEGNASMTIRALRPDDLPQVQEVLATRDGVGPEDAARRTEILGYIAFCNPYADPDEGRYFVVEDEGRIVALHGRMPVMFSIGGKRFKGYYVHDLSVHRSALKKAQGLMLTLALAQAIEEETDSFLCLLGMTPLNQMMQRRRRYHELFTDSYVKVLRPEHVLPAAIGQKWLARLLGLCVRPLVAAADWFIHRRHRRLPEPVPDKDFDERFDRLFERVAAKFPVCTVKDAAYLNWKYGDGPCNEDTVLVRREGDEILGSIIVGTVISRGVDTGVIKEIMADPEDTETLSILVSGAVRFLARQKVSAILCLLSDERIGRILRRFLFFRRAGHEALFIGNLEKAGAHRELLSDIRNWHMMFGESDLFMFGRDRPSILKNWKSPAEKASS